MKITHTAALLLLCTAPAFASIQIWEWSGTLNLVSAPLAGQFSTGETFTVRMNVDTDAPMIYGARNNFYTSGSSYNSIVSATVTVNDWYTAGFISGSKPSSSTVTVTNAEERASASYYDQLMMSFFSSQGLIDAPVVDTGSETFTVNSIEFNLYGPVSMIVGSGATFPAADAPMVIPGVNFFPEENTNGAYNFIIRFQEGSGVNMLRGTFNNFAVVPEASHVAALLGLSAVALVGLKRRKRA